ncbi:M23 family metallopeptidase [Corynebacterium sp. H113]|uniref:M23 family metallopeptidase n=1 Tax=Corynebacterium sp. H113 TaxID=3133419 RepID=UPI0030A6FF69
MSNTTTIRKGGAHRKQSSTVTSRIAAVTLTASAITAAGTASAAAQPDTNKVIDHKADKETAAKQLSTTPMVLASDNFSPSTDLGAQLATAISYNAERVQRDLALRAPTTAKPAEGTFTSGFGPRWGSMHNGIDVANAVNTPILAVMSGTVIDSGPASGYGQWIRIKHDDGAISVYGHLETLGVSVGERVMAGQLIGGMGNRGFSTGSHLHFEIWPDGATPVDPMAWLNARGIYY